MTEAFISCERLTCERQSAEESEKFGKRTHLSPSTKVFVDLFGELALRNESQPFLPTDVFDDEFSNALGSPGDTLGADPGTGAYILRFFVPPVCDLPEYDLLDL